MQAFINMYCVILPTRKVSFLSLSILIRLIICYLYLLTLFYKLFVFHFNFPTVTSFSLGNKYFLTYLLLAVEMLLEVSKGFLWVLTFWFLFIELVLYFHLFGHNTRLIFFYFTWIHFSRIQAFFSKLSFYYVTYVT